MILALTLSILPASLPQSPPLQLEIDAEKLLPDAHPPRNSYCIRSQTPRNKAGLSNPPSSRVLSSIVVGRIGRYPTGANVGQNHHEMNNRSLAPPISNPNKIATPSSTATGWIVYGSKAGAAQLPLAKIGRETAGANVASMRRCFTTVEGCAHERQRRSADPRW